MRKSLILVVILLAFSIGLIFVAHDNLLRYKDTVSIKETVISGDRLAAEGITVSSKTDCGNHLFWDTVYTIGEELEVKTDYTFFQTKVQQNFKPEPSIQLYTVLNFGISNSGGAGINLSDDPSKTEDSGIPESPMRAVAAVAGRTPDGETREEDVFLKDYYDFYPVTLDINLPGTPMQIDSVTLQAVSRYFGIPVFDEHKLHVSVTKDIGGIVTDVNCQSLSGGADFYSNSAITDAGCYMAITMRDENGELMDLPTGTSGIHLLPFAKKEGITELSVKKIRQVYPIDENVHVLRLMKSPDEKRLLLFTEENSASILSVIDIASMKLLQKIELKKGPENLDFWEIKQYDDFLAAVFSDGKFVLLSVSDDGSYETQFSGDLNVNKEIGVGQMLTPSAAMDYDGKRLAIVSYQQTVGSCSTYLAVYDKDGLAYAGKYDNSSDRDFTESLSKDILPIDSTPLSVSFGIPHNSD